jgi:hypothetical protein
MAPYGSTRLSYRGTERRNRRGGYNLFEDGPGNREILVFQVPATKRLRNVPGKWARSSLDSEYIILAFVLTLIGVSGIVLFNGPKTPAGDSCVCIIPSPESGAMQGTAGILLIFGVMFIPIGILKGGLPGRRTVPPTGMTVGSGRTYSPQWISSGGQLVFGIALVVLGVDVLVVPGYLVLNSIPIIGSGIVLAALGTILAYRGSRIRKQ